jgi:hypothetical protein
VVRFCPFPVGTEFAILIGETGLISLKIYPPEIRILGKPPGVWGIYTDLIFFYSRFNLRLLFWFKKGNRFCRIGRTENAVTVLVHGKKPGL